MNTEVFLQFPVIETERMQLVRHDMRHAEQMFKLRTNTSVMKYLDAPMPKDIDEVRSKIRENIDSFDHKSGIPWVITLKEDGTAIGYASIWKIDHKNHRGEVGYALLPDYWGKGMATEAVTAIIRFGFENIGLHTMMANTNPSNEASQGLLKKLGFQQEAYHRQDYFFDGAYLDSAIFGLLRSDFFDAVS